MTVVIDFEEDHHYGQVDELHRIAFDRGDEVQIVRKLRGRKDTISLVASVSGILFGHTVLWPLVVDPPTMARELRIAAVGPVAVDPRQQRRGIGAALVKEAIAEARALGYDAVAAERGNEFWTSLGFERAGEFNLRSPNAESAERCGILWLTSPRVMNTPVDLLYQPTLRHGKKHARD